MSGATSTSIISWDLRRINYLTRHRSQASALKLGLGRSSLLTNHGLLLRISHGVRSSKNNTQMDMTVRSNVQAGVPGPPSSSWKNWVVGTLLSIILPFWKHKWAPLLAIKNRVEMVIETIETVTEVVEKVAEEVEKVADEVANSLPEGGKLQEAACFVEHAAKKIAHDAHAAEQFIHKVEEVEKEVEREVESLETMAKTVLEVEKEMKSIGTLTEEMVETVKEKEAADPENKD